MSLFNNFKASYQLSADIADVRTVTSQAFVIHSAPANHIQIYIWEVIVRLLIFGDFMSLSVFNISNYNFVLQLCSLCW